MLVEVMKNLQRHIMKVLEVAQTYDGNKGEGMTPAVQCGVTRRNT